MLDRTKTDSRCQVCRRLIKHARADAKTCSPRCRQMAYRRRAGVTARCNVRHAKPAIKAHQKIIREQLIIHAPEPAATDIKASVVREISYADAKVIIEQFEYLGTMPAFALHCFGIFFGDRLGGAVVYASEPTENLGVWDRLGYSGKIICLARGACAHWAHHHAASRLIRRSMRLLPGCYQVITATVDPSAGEIGIVYQASGFDFVGTMTAGGDRLRVSDRNGQVLSDRTARRRFGSSAVNDLLQAGLHVEQCVRKGRYFAFRGPDRAALRTAIADRTRAAAIAAISVVCVRRVLFVA
jgi:hypothetical protein